MYFVMYGTEFLYEPDNDERAVHNATLSQTADGVATFKFTMPPTNPMTQVVSVRDMANPVEVWFDETLLFSGYIESLTDSLWLETEVSCKSHVALLNDTMTRYKPTSNRGNYVLAELIGMWANLTTWGGEIPQKKIEFAVDPQSQASSVGYTDPNGGGLIVDAETTSPKGILDIIRDSMIDPYGAFLRTRKADDGTILVGVFPNAPDTSTQVVRLGENLLDYNYTETDEGMYNCCLPVGGAIDPRTIDGARQTNVVVASNVAAGSRSIQIRTSSGTANVHTGNVLVIGGKYGYAVEGGYDGDFGTGAVTVDVTPPVEQAISAGTGLYIQRQALYQKDENCTLMDIPGYENGWRVDYDLVYNVDSVNAYGMRCWTFQDNDIRDAYALRNKAIAQTAARLEFKRSLTVSALDMVFYLSGYTHLQAGQQLRVISEPHGLDTVMYVRTADINLDDPSQTKYVLGTIGHALSRHVRQVESNVKTGADNFIKELNNRIPQSTIQGLS